MTPPPPFHFSQLHHDYKLCQIVQVRLGCFLQTPPSPLDRKINPQCLALPGICLPNSSAKSPRPRSYNHCRVAGTWNEAGNFWLNVPALPPPQWSGTGLGKAPCELQTPKNWLGFQLSCPTRWRGLRNIIPNCCSWLWDIIPALPGSARCYPKLTLAAPREEHPL